MCLSFYYHMYGSNMGDLDVIVNGKVPISLSGNQGNQWKKIMKTISGVTGKREVTTFFLLCTFSGAESDKICYLFILEILAVTSMYMSFFRPSTCPPAPRENQPEISHFLVSVGACNLILHIYAAVN